MPANALPRLVIAGTHSGAGKTTVSMGLMAALSRKMTVQPYKVGPDYIDPAYHTFITGRKSRNLDGYLLGEEVLLYLLKKNMAGAEIAVIEGVMGLFDGLSTGNYSGSTAHIARVCRAPVLLVVDGSGMAASAAALVGGYHHFCPDLPLAGVIFNRLSGEGHYRILKEAVEVNTGVRVFGYLAQEAELELPSRHLGLVPSGEIPALRAKVDRLVAEVERTVEVEALVRLAREWPQPLPAGKFHLELLELPGVNEAGIEEGRMEEAGREEVSIAVAYDEAFNFYYWDSLELLEEMGARLEYFSPLRDKELPAGASALLLGGGFPEVFAQELQENAGMRSDVKNKLEQGLPYLAECGGLMYLLTTLVDFSGKEYEMAGYLQGKCRMTPRLQRFGYADLRLEKTCVLGKKGDRIRIHEFHRSLVEGTTEPTAYLLSKQKGPQQEEKWQCGYLKDNGIAGYPHLHFYGNPGFARHFLAAARQYRARQIKQI